jgi:hypothetical protein
MDMRPDLLDLAEKEESDEGSYEPGWYTILKENAEAAGRTEATQTA